MTIHETTQERRRHRRTQLSISAHCIRLDPDGGDVTDRLDVVDISRSGMGAICSRPFYPGQRIIICLPRATGGHRTIYASIVRCRHRTEGYHIGLEFDPSALGRWADSEPERTAVAA